MRATIESIAETVAFLYRRSKSLSFKDAVTGVAGNYPAGNPQFSCEPAETRTPSQQGVNRNPGIRRRHPRLDSFSRPSRVAYADEAASDSLGDGRFQRTGGGLVFVLYYS